MLLIPAASIRLFSSRSSGEDFQVSTPRPRTSPPGGLLQRGDARPHPVAGFAEPGALIAKDAQSMDDRRHFAKR
jgi:hypothetical protein